MSTLIIFIVIIVIYFIIVAIKENESRESIDRERKVNMRNIADIHYQNLVQNELMKQNFLKEIHKNFISELECEDYIQKATIDNKVLNITLVNHTDYDDALQFADNLVNSLNSTTEIDVVKVYYNDNLLANSRRRGN